MTLKEEIDNILWYPESEESIKKYPLSHEALKLAIDDKTEKIIKLIKSKIELVTERPPLNEYFGYSGDQEFLDGFDLGFEKALELVEMELEK